jgi:hypothetical protein
VCLFLKNIYYDIYNGPRTYRCAGELLPTS